MSAEAAPCGQSVAVAAFQGVLESMDELEQAKQRVREVWSRYATVDEENKAWEELRSAARRDPPYHLRHRPESYPHNQT